MEKNAEAFKKSFGGNLKKNKKDEGYVTECPGFYDAKNLSYC